MDEQEKKWHFREMVIPEYMRDGVEHFINLGQPVGDFLKAVICNKLEEAVMYADDTNILILPAYANYFYNYAPRKCWGSEKAYNQWIELKRKENNHGR